MPVEGAGAGRAVLALGSVTALVTTATAPYAALLVAAPRALDGWPVLGALALTVNGTLLALTLLTAGVRVPAPGGLGRVRLASWTAILLAPVGYAIVLAWAADSYRLEELHGRRLDDGPLLLLLLGLPALGVAACGVAALVSFRRSGLDPPPDSPSGRRSRTRLFGRMGALALTPTAVLVVLLVAGVPAPVAAVSTTAVGVVVLLVLLRVALRPAEGPGLPAGLRRNTRGGALTLGGAWNLCLASVPVGIGMGSTELDGPTLTLFAAGAVLALVSLVATVVGLLVRRRGRRETGLPEDEFSDINPILYLPDL